MSPAGRSVLVAGGGGSLSSAFVAKWLDRDWEATILESDDLAPFATLKRTPQLTVVRGSLDDSDLVQTYVERCDVVILLAALVGADGYAAGPEGLLDTNILGTRRVLRACVELGRPVVLGGTSAVYGCTAGVLHEQSPRTLGSHPSGRWGDAISSLAAEEYAMALARRGLRYIIVRYFDVYGPQIDQPGTGRIVSRFLQCIREHAPLYLVDSGEAVRSFCYVDDAAEATAVLAESLLESDALAGRVFNVGSNEAVSIAQLAEHMARLSNHAAGVISVSGETAGGADFETTGYRVPDLAAIRAAVGFEAKTSLDAGLRKCLGRWGLLAPPPSDGQPLAAATHVDRVPWVRPIFDAHAEVFADMQAALSAGRVTNNGPRVVEFERRLATYLGVEDCVAVSSGSAALLLAVQALGLGGAKAVLPSFTFIATLNALVHGGIAPVFCDIEPDTWTLSPAHLRSLLAADPAIRLVVPVNVFGVPPDLRAIRRIVDDSNAVLMLDNAHGLGTECDGVRSACEPSVQTYSLHATKTLPAVEGGAVVSSDARLLAEVRRLRNHGLASDPLASTPGYNAKLSELHAAVALQSLHDLDTAVARRRQYAARLRRVLTEDCAATFSVQRVPDAVESNFQNLAVLCRDVERQPVTAIQATLEGEGIETRRYFWPPLHQLPAFCGRWALPVTDEVGRAVLCLPLHSRMEPPVLERIEAALRRSARRPD